MFPEMPSGTARELARLPDNKARAEWCLEKQRQANADWCQGRQEMIEYVLNSKSLQFARFSPEQRRNIGILRWQTHALGRGLISDEQMFSRWAAMFQAFVENS